VNEDEDYSNFLSHSIVEFIGLYIPIPMEIPPDHGARGNPREFLISSRLLRSSANRRADLTYNVSSVNSWKSYRRTIVGHRTL